MNHDLEHQELARLNNLQAQRKAENARMEELERRAAPMFYTILIVVGILAGAGIYFGW